MEDIFFTHLPLEVVLFISQDVRVAQRCNEDRRQAQHNQDHNARDKGSLFIDRSLGGRSGGFLQGAALVG